MTVVLSEIPPEQLSKGVRDPVAYLKEWAEEFKADMENAPDIGRFCKVEVGVEEG